MLSAMLDIGWLAESTSMISSSVTRFEAGAQGILVQVGWIPLLIVAALAVGTIVLLGWRGLSRHKLKLVQVKVSVPFDLGELTFETDECQRHAAWELYVELTTRIAVQELARDEGLIREALASLYSLFGTTRAVLRGAGPTVGASQDTVGGVAIAALNRGLRPFLAKWHPLLRDWEHERPEDRSPREHEQKWDHYGEVRKALDALRSQLRLYAHALAKIAGISVQADLDKP